MAMQTVPLASSAISSVTYDSETQDMSIEFASGQSYDFHGVPQEIFDGLVAAPSPGRYYHALIKGQYA